eukprot:COSAG01_NODE_1791_length_9221_cov_7.677373_7_plen_70_part_00
MTNFHFANLSRICLLNCEFCTAVASFDSFLLNSLGIFSQLLASYTMGYTWLQLATELHRNTRRWMATAA